VVLSHDTSGCSCIFVASPPPSDAVPALWFVSTPVMFAAVCVLLLWCAKHLRACAWCRCRRAVTCASVAVSLA
jgi:hypothetical protein